VLQFPEAKTRGLQPSIHFGAPGRKKMLGKLESAALADLLDGARVRLELDAAPIPLVQPATSASGAKAVDPTLITGFQTMPTSLEAAAARAVALSREAQRLVDAGELGCFFRLLENHPDLAMESRVAELLRAAMQDGRFGRNRGRPPGIYTIPPPAVYSLVQALIASGRAENVDDAFRWLEEEKALPLTYAAAKTKYYQALREPRFRGLLFRRVED
jgi:hypothetical protein